MRYRKLRIAWSVAWGIVVVLLIVLWARSHASEDTLRVRPGFVKFLGFVSRTGTIKFAAGSPDSSLPPSLEWWDFESGPVNPWSIDLVPQSALGFGMLHLKNVTFNLYIMRLPHWFCALSVAVVAILPLLFQRFSLRTHLIATTLVSVVLGFIVWSR